MLGERSMCLLERMCNVTMDGELVLMHMVAARLVDVSSLGSLARCSKCIHSIVQSLVREARKAYEAKERLDARRGAAELYLLQQTPNHLEIAAQRVQHRLLTGIDTMGGADAALAAATASATASATATENVRLVTAEVHMSEEPRASASPDLKQTGICCCNIT